MRYNFARGKLSNLISVDFNVRTTFANFYESVTKEINKEITELTCFDCREIEVSNFILSEIIEYYKEEGYFIEEISAMVLCYGPKVNASLKDNQVAVSNLFVS